MGSFAESFEKIDNYLSGSSTEPLSYEDLVSVERPEATYHIHPVKNHGVKTRATGSYLSDFDAIVLEEGLNAFEDVNLNQFLQHDQYENIIRENVRGPRNSIFIADIPYEKKPKTGIMTEVSAKCYLPAIAGVAASFQNPATLALSLPAMSLHLSGADSNYLDKAAPYLQLSQFHTSFGLRSAVTSQKLEHMPRIIDSENPDIFVEYGKGHLDIKTYLENPWLRSRVIDFHSLYGFGKRDADKIDELGEYRFGEGSSTLLLDNELVSYEKITHEL